MTAIRYCTAPAERVARFTQDTWKARRSPRQQQPSRDSSVPEALVVSNKPITAHSSAAPDIM